MSLKHLFRLAALYSMSNQGVPVESQLADEKPTDFRESVKQTIRAFFNMLS